MITSIGIYLAIIGLASYFIWFILINKCELASNLIKTLAGDPTYTIDDIVDLISVAFIQLLAIPFLIFASLITLWPIIIILMIIFIIYRRKYRL